MPASPQDQQTSGPKGPLGLPEIDRIISQTSDLVRQMLKEAAARIHRLAEQDATSR